jgi:hypothetical protein
MKLTVNVERFAIRTANSRRPTAELARCVLALLISALALTSLSAATLPNRTEVFRMLRQERFDELEKVTGDLRSEKLEFYSGRSKIAQFYDLLEISRNLDDDSWSNHIARFERWSKAYPDSPTPLVALGDIYISFAWKARGGGYANSVTEEGWRLFKERLTRAREVLDEAAQKSVQDPEAYRARIVVAMGLDESKPKMNSFFKKGVAAEPNYLPLYEAKAYYLLPRWNGAPGDWEEFAREAADARGGEEGDMLYMIIARSQAWSEGDHLFRTTSLSYARMKRGFEACVRRNPDYLWDVNSYCYFACIANDRSQAKELFKKIDGRWEKGVWGTTDQFQRWENWALHNGTAPTLASRSSGVNAAHLKTALLIGGIIWLAIVAAIVVGIWQMARNYRKSD